MDYSEHIRLAKRHIDGEYAYSRTNSQGLLATLQVAIANDIPSESQKGQLVALERSLRKILTAAPVVHLALASGSK